MWDLILRREYGEIVIKTYRSKQEAEEEIKNRSRLISILGEDINKLYKIKKGKTSGRTSRNLSTK